MQINDEILSRYVDGQASPEDAYAVAAALQSNPSVHRRFRDLKRADIDFALHLYGITEPSLPKTAATSPAQPDASPLKRFADRLVDIIGQGLPGMMRPGVAMGLLGFAAVVGLSVLNLSPSDNSGYSGIASLSPEVVRVLDQASGGMVTQISTGEATVTLSFARKTGGFCRELSIASATLRESLIACRDNDAWTPVAAFYESGSQSFGGAWAQASATASAGVEAVVDGLIKGQPLNRDEESRLIRGNWTAGSAQ